MKKQLAKLFVVVLLCLGSPLTAEGTEEPLACVEVPTDAPLHFGWPSPKGEWHHMPNARIGEQTWRHQGSTQILSPTRSVGDETWMAYFDGPGKSHTFGPAVDGNNPTEIHRFFECCPSKTLKVEVDTLGPSWGAFPSPRGEWKVDSTGTCWIHEDGKQAFAEWYGTWMWFLQDPQNQTKPCESFINVAVSPSRGGGDPREIDWSKAPSGRLFNCQ